MKTKICPNCGPLPEDQFYLRSKCDRQRDRCIPCTRARSRQIHAQKRAALGLTVKPRVATTLSAAQRNIKDRGEAALLRWRRAEFGEFREPERLLTTLAQPLHRYA